jgi:zinc protease
MPMLRKFRLTAAAAFAGIALAACQPAEKTGAGFSIPELSYSHRTLDNGLEVYAMPASDTASVAVQVWYKVGSKDDPPGRSGFAHLFEHIMFKATTNMPSETMDRLTEDAGGFNNASTWDDFTNYYEVVPANHLERVLWGEAERMGSLVVDEAIFDSERDVVKEEFRQNYDASPYGKFLGLYLTQASYDIHPYGRPGIGSLAQLDAATVEDVRAFHAAYYRPDNAVLVVSGNFEQAQLDTWIDQYFGPIKTPAREIPRVTVTEPARAATKDLTVYEPNVPLPAVAISWPSPAASSPDLAAMTMLDAILSSGQSSRLYQSLVYEQQLAADAGTMFEAKEHAGIYAIYAILSDGKAPEDGLAALKAEVAKLRDAPVTDAELEEARNELVMSQLTSRETPEGRAFDLAYSVTIYGDPDASDKQLDALMKVTAADVQRVAGLLFDDTKQITLRYLPEEMQNGAAEDVIADSPNIQATTISIPASDITIYTLAPEASRVQPPAAGPAVAATVPGAEEKTLPNGLRVIVANKPGLPVVSATLRIASGSSLDTQSKAGLAGLTADIATRGTAARSATQISQEIESLGAAISAGAGPDSTGVSIQARSDKAAAAFAIMADVVRNPAFAAEEVERARQETLDNLMVGMRQPSTIAQKAITRLMFGPAPYGSTPSPASVAGITQDDIAAFHAARWRPDQAILVIAGDVTSEEGFALAETAFGEWARPEGAAPPAVELAYADEAAPPAVVVDIPQIGQAAVSFGLMGPARTAPDYAAALVATDVLGGGYSARLNNEIRIKRGLSYGVRAGLPSRKSAPAIGVSAQTRNDAAIQVVDLMLAEFARLGAEAIPAAEIDARKAVIIGGFGRSVETTGGLAGQLAELAQFGLPLSNLQTWASEIAAVTADQAGEAARTYYDPAKAAMVVAGDAQVFFNGLKAKYPNVERINIDTLNLDSETLK